MDLSCEDAHIHVVNFEDFWLLEMPAFRAMPRRARADPVLFQERSTPSRSIGLPIPRCGLAWARLFLPLGFWLGRR